MKVLFFAVCGPKFLKFGKHVASDCSFQRRFPIDDILFPSGDIGDQIAKSGMIETSAVKYNGRRPASWRAAIIISPPNSDKIVMWRFLRNRRLLTHNFQGTHILGASRGYLSDSVASCYRCFCRYCSHFCSYQPIIPILPPLLISVHRSPPTPATPLNRAVIVCKGSSQDVDAGLMVDPAMMTTVVIAYCNIFVD